MRTDEHRNPAAFTVDIARQAGLILGTDYEIGASFPGSTTLHTAKLLGDPVALTIKVIDKIGFYTKSGLPRWTYISLPSFVWRLLTADEKRDVIGFMYQHEGGSALVSLFPKYGAV
jgi:hypothetical protein